VATVREQLSKDGNELITTTATAGHADQITVWTRSGGAKIASDLFVGEWTQDLSKTRCGKVCCLRSRQTETVGSVFWVTSAIPPVLMENNTIKEFAQRHCDLELVDPRTVDAIYRRDEQITQTDRWQASADGQQMTLSTTGTLESGQRITEKLLFKNQ